MIPEFLRHVFLLQGFLVHRVEYLKIILQVYKDIMYYNVYIYIYYIIIYNQLDHHDLANILMIAVST